MQPYSIEQSVLDGSAEVKNLFDFVQNNAGKLELYEIEKEIFSMLMNIGLTALKCYFAKIGTGDIGDELIMDDGAILPKAKRFRERDYFSIFGKIKISRTCYRTKDHAGVMPLDAQVNLPTRCYSYLLQEMMDLCSVRDGFGESAVTLNKLLGLDIKVSRFEIVSQESTNHYDEFYENHKETPSAKDEGELQVIGFDGKGVPVIKKEATKIQARLGKGEKRQKSKEAMVGVSYSVDRNVRVPEDVAKNLIYPEQAREKKEQLKNDGHVLPKIKGKNIRRMASLARSKKEVVKNILQDAMKRTSNNNEPMIVVMDGALALWVLITTMLTGVKWVGILDIIHVAEYLWKVGNALYGEKTPESRTWVYKHLLAILEGRVGRVIGGLKQTKTKRALTASQKKAINKAIKYFENHWGWMRYDEYLIAGYPIGSGVVESTCGHTVKNRMEGTGRRWSIEGAESILLLRSIYTSNDWNEYWKLRRASIRLKRYGNIMKALDYADDYCIERAV